MIESKLWENCGQKVEGTYQDQIRLLINNLKSGHNKELRIKLLNSEITCDQISKMSADDFMSDE